MARSRQVDSTHADSTGVVHSPRRLAWSVAIVALLVFAGATGVFLARPWHDWSGLAEWATFVQGIVGSLGFGALAVTLWLQARELSATRAEVAQQLAASRDQADAVRALVLAQARPSIVFELEDDRGSGGVHLSIRNEGGRLSNVRLSVRDPSNPGAAHMDLSAGLGVVPDDGLVRVQPGVDCRPIIERGERLSVFAIGAQRGHLRGVLRTRTQWAPIRGRTIVVRGVDDAGREGEWAYPLASVEAG